MAPDPSHGNDRANRGGLHTALAILTAIISGVALIADNFGPFSDTETPKQVIIYIGLLAIIYMVHSVLTAGGKSLRIISNIVFVGVIAYFAFILLCPFIGCPPLGTNEDSPDTELSAETSDTIGITKINGKKWTKNPISLVVDKSSFLATNGFRYYTFEAAKKACEDLEPGQWRLPDGLELKSLDDSNFPLEIGGWGSINPGTGQIQSVQDDRDIGFYWTTTRVSIKKAKAMRYYKINKLSGPIEEISDDHALLCYCVEKN